MLDIKRPNPLSLLIQDSTNSSGVAWLLRKVAGKESRRVTPAPCGLVLRPFSVTSVSDFCLAFGLHRGRNAAVRT